LFWSKEQLLHTQNILIDQTFGCCLTFTLLTNALFKNLFIQNFIGLHLKRCSHRVLCNNLQHGRAWLSCQQKWNRSRNFKTI